MGAAWEGGSDPAAFYNSEWIGDQHDDCDSNYDNISGTGFSNIQWFGAEVYVGSSVSLSSSSLTFCGYAGADRLIEYTGSGNKLNDVDTVDMMRMGGSVKCPDDAGKSSHVVIRMT